MTTPEVSVVIPTYNGARFIREALESVFNQTLPPLEIIVVDDASGDETANIVSSMIHSAQAPLGLIPLEVNSGGPARPLNTGIRAASGEYIAVLDQDDVFLPDKLEKQAGLLASHPHLAFAFSYCGSFTQPEQIMQRPSLVQELNALGRKKGGHYEIAWKEMLTLLMRDTNFIYGYPGFVFRHRDWERKGGLDESLQIASDYEFLCWLACQGPAGFVPEIGYLRREHGRNLSDRLYWCLLEALRVRVQYLLKKRELLCDKAFEQGLKKNFLYLAHHWLDAKYDSLALECLQGYSRLWGWEKEALKLLELLPRKWLSESICRPASYTDFTKPCERERKAKEGRVLVSVVIIFLNNETHLREAVESVFAQTFTDWELLLVDDGSTDGSTQIAKEFAQTHPQKVRYLEHGGRENKGMGASRNLGAARACGKFLAFLDADDLWFPEKLDKQVSLLEQYPEAGLAASPALYWYEDGRKELQPITLSPGLIPQGAWIPKILENENEAACPTMVLMRRNLTLQWGCFEESFRTLYEDQLYEDQMMWCKANLNAPVYYHPECLGLYRIHPASFCRSVSLEQRAFARLRFNSRLTALILKHHTPPLRRSNFLAAMAQAKFYDTITNSEDGHFEAGKNGSINQGFFRLRRNVKRVSADGHLLGYVFSGVLLLDVVSGRLSSKLAKRIFMLAKTAYYEGLSRALEEAVKILPRYVLRKVRPFVPPLLRIAVRRALNFTSALLPRLRLTVFTRPLSYRWGGDRGLPLHRYYLEKFLKEFSRDIQGYCLEFQENLYAARFGGPSLTKVDILHKGAGNPCATFIADLTQPNNLPDNRFDCIICTHVLHVIFELDKAVSELHRILKPGGVLLAAVPHVSMCDPRWHEVWRFTPEGLALVLAKAFGKENITVRAYGNSLTAAGEIRGLSAAEFAPAELDFCDPCFAVEVCVRAVKN